MASLTAPEVRAAMEAARQRGDFGVAPRSAAIFKVNERDRAWVDAQCVVQPIGTMLQPIRLTGARDRIVKKSYIRASAYDSPYFQGYYTALRKDPAWRCYEVACGHDVMLDDPDRLTEILLEVA